MKNLDITFGTDPEFFVSYEQDGKQFCVPPIFFKKFLGVNPIVPDKKHPIYIKTPNKILIHQDGAAFEFNVPTFKNAEQCKNLINEGLVYLTDFANQYGYTSYTRPVIYFDPVKYFIEQDEEFQDCVIFGCDRDWDAFDYVNYNSDELNVINHPYRYGGGHLHISTKSFSLKPLILPAIKLMALFVGNYFIANSPCPEEEKLRAFHYGKPGKFRPQKYPDGSEGIEYRTPSNSWLSLSVDKMQEMLEQAKKALYVLQDMDKTAKLIERFGNETISAIVDCNQDLANNILLDLQKEI